MKLSKAVCGIVIMFLRKVSVPGLIFYFNTSAEFLLLSAVLVRFPVSFSSLISCILLQFSRWDVRNFSFFSSPHPSLFVKLGKNSWNSIKNVKSSRKILDAWKKYQKVDKKFLKPRKNFRWAKKQLHKLGKNFLKLRKNSEKPMKNYWSPEKIFEAQKKIL